MKVKIKKRHIVLAALVLALGAAVYLNWQLGSTDSSKLKQVDSALGEATYVSNNTSTADQKSNSKDDYFSKAKTERTKSQDEVLDIAKEVLQLSESSDEAKKEAVDKSDTIQKRILNQTNIEQTLLAKGFSKCLCFLSDEGCNVIVLKKEMNESSPLVIKDAVTSQVNLDFDDIKIVEI